MLSVETRHAIDPASAKALDTEGLRRHFHAGGMFAEGEIRLVYTHYDRMIIGAAVPAGGVLVLDHVKECGTASVLDRREMAVLNIGSIGTVTAAGTEYTMNKGDVVYLGLGSGPVSFAGGGRFYILSAPAHRDFPVAADHPGRCKVVPHWRARNRQRPHDLSVRPPRGDGELPAGDGLHPVPWRFGLEHHAGASARPADGGLSLFRPRPGRSACFTSWASRRRPGIW